MAQAPAHMYWLWTWNLPWDNTQDDRWNYTRCDDYIEHLKIMCEESKPWLSYICWGEETGESGNFHLQGYLQCANAASRKRLTFLTKYFSDKGTQKTTWGIHFIVQQGKGNKTKTINEINRDYCFKDGLNLWWHGEFRGKSQGRRKGLEEAGALLLETGDINSLLNEDYVVHLLRHPAGCKMVAGLSRQKTVDKRRKVKMYWFWGVTGGGKTFAAHQNFEHPSYFVKSGISFKKNDYFEGYNGEQLLIIDDWQSKHMDIKQLMELGDGGIQLYPIRYGKVYAEWTEVIITTNFPYPQAVYPNAFPGSRAALFRRINGGIFEFDHPWQEGEEFFYKPVFGPEIEPVGGVAPMEQDDLKEGEHIHYGEIVDNFDFTFEEDF